VVCDLVPTDDHTRFGQTWVDQLVAHADHDLPAGPARWVRLAVGLVATNTSSATPSWRPSNGSAAVSGPTVTATLSAGLPRSIGATRRATSRRRPRPGLAPRLHLVTSNPRVFAQVLSLRFNPSVGSGLAVDRGRRRVG
jgi:hypothetical protein